MNQIPSDHEKLRNVLISKLGLPTDRFQPDNLIAEGVQGVIFERDSAVSQIGGITKVLVESGMMGRNINTSIEALVEIARQPKKITPMQQLVAERDSAAQQALELNRELLEFFPDDLCDLLGLENGFTPKQFHTAIDGLRTTRAQPVTTGRYIVHGHVQPCTVLYSDESTTLVRLEDQDMMCSTGTVEWSDELTYRCQELLASAGLERNTLASQRVLPVLASLVANGALHFDDGGCDPAYYTTEAVQQPEFVAPIGGFRQ